MTFKPLLIKRKGFWYVSNPLGNDAKYVAEFVAQRWIQAYYWCNLLNYK